MEFEWDPDKAELNFSKHKVSFHEATTIFGDAFSLTNYDPDHSENEDRYITLGESSDGNLLIVSHTERDDQIRIISARRATRRERRAYENE